MKKDEFAHAVLDLWMKTNIPLTPASLQYHTGVSRRKLRRWTDQMVVDGELEFDSDDDGEVIYTVPGGRRPADGPRTFLELERMESLRAGVAADRDRKAAHKAKVKAKMRAENQALVAQRESSLGDRLRDEYTAGTALSIAGSARRELEHGRGAGDKSILVSGALSFFFGPLGWLYAGHFREAIPAALAFVLIVKLLPLFLLMPIFGIALPISGLAGMAYAWQHNRKGERTPLLGDGSKDE